MRLAFAIALTVCGCTASVPVQDTKVMTPGVPADTFSTLKDAAGAHAELCDHDPGDTTFPDQADRITNRFCQDVKGGAVPTPHSLAELLQVMNMDFKDHTGGNGTGGNPAFAILGHSSALTAREVSALTPTVFVFTPLNADGTPPPDYTFVAFDPGEPFLEVASFSPADQAVNFYIVLFDKACTSTPEGCGPNDLLTPAQTTGWSNLRIYESTTALNNTIADCRQCHIGAGKDLGDGGGGDPLILRMQEIAPPHTHWFSRSTDGGKALLADFHAARGSDDYGPIPGALIDQSDPELMAQFIRAAGFGDQPNAFPSAQVEQEVDASAPDQPAMNMPAGASPTWDAIFEASAEGRAIPVPYHDVKVTDPAKLAHMTSVYQAWRSGQTPALDTDIRDVFLDAGLVDMGFASPPSATGRELLVQQCQECHDTRLDPTLTRDRFLVDQLDQMSRDEKDLAIQRIGLPPDTRLTMPPQLFRTVTPAQRQLMIEELER